MTTDYLFDESIYLVEEGRLQAVATEVVATVEALKAEGRFR